MPSEEDPVKPVSSDGNVFIYSGASRSETYRIIQENLNDLFHDLYLFNQQSKLHWHSSRSSRTWSRQMYAPAVLGNGTMSLPHSLI